jgi:PAS domain S-box-containing protein
MWISEADQEVLAIWVEHCPALKLVSGPGGEIFWANRAFREFSEYTLKELQGLGWKRLSVDSESLDADLQALQEIQSGYIQDYTVNKQYRTKSGSAKWGILTVLRYPAAGPIQCFLCTFEPLKNGTATAFELAVDRINAMTTAIEGVKAEVKTLTTMDADATWVDATIKLVKRHPKFAGAFFAVALSIFGLNNVVELLQRVGLIQLPVKIQPVNVGEHETGATALNISDEKSERWIITTSDGNVIETPVDTSKERGTWRAKISEQF